MKHLVILFLTGFTCLAQPRSEKPLPYFPKKPAKLLSDEVTGWSYSLDGQWLSEEQKIPVRLVSRNEDAYQKEQNEPGLDNFDQFQLYPALYGNDTLVLLVKLFEEGAYEFPQSKENWQDYTNAYFYLFNKDQLKKLQRFSAQNSELLHIELLQDGLIKDLNRRNALERIKEKLKIDPEYDRQLVFTGRSYTLKNNEREKGDSPSRIQFQIFSSHKSVADVEGVVQDFRINGTSLYGRPALLDYLYYECDRQRFVDFFTLPAELKFVLK